MKRCNSLFIVFTLVLVVSTLSIYMGMRAPYAYGSAVIWTDKPAYAPQETVTISGSGFNLNTNILLTITRPNLVVDTGSTVSDASGNFTYYYVLDGIVGTYTVTATDGTNTASTTFTDLHVDWVQGHDDKNPHDGVVDTLPMVKWANGALNSANSVFTEGNIVPPYPPHIPGHINYRAIFDGLDAGTYVLTIEYEFTKGGIVAFDFLTTNYGITDANLQTQLPAWADATKISSLVTAGPFTATFPTDSFSLPSGLGGGTVADRQTAHDTAFTGFNPRKMKLYGVASITGITEGSHADDVTSDSSATVVITFTKTTDNTWPVIATWGGHLGIGVAYPVGYGTGKGAGGISGAPFHMSLDSLIDCSTSKDVIPGDRDRSVQSGAIILFVPVTITADKWNDLNGNGVKDAGEPEIAGWQLTITCPNGTTNTMGSPASWAVINAGTFVVTEELQAGWVHTTLSSVGLTVQSGNTPSTVWFGNFKVPPAQCTICDFVWKDLDHDGIQDVGEPGFSGVAVNLYDSLGSFVATTTTNGNGLYHFTVDPGRYYLEFVPPSGYVLTLQDQGTDDARDSDANPATHKTAIFTVTSGQIDSTQDAGMYSTPAPVGGEWIPTNKSALLAPWISLGSVTVLITASFVYVKRKKKQMN